MERRTKEITWFRNGLYLFLLYKAFVYFYHFRTLFSIRKMIYTQPGFLGGIKDWAFFLNNYYSVKLSVACIVLLVVLSFIGLAKKSNYVTNALLWLLMLNMNNFLYSTLTAGDYLLNQLLFFNIFFSIKDYRNPTWNDLKNSLHQMAFAGIRIQVCLVYFLAGWFKLTDPAWLSGDALYRIFQIPEYSNGFLMALPYGVCLVLTYITIVYQLLFPVLIWLRPLKLYVLAFGIIQHLLIAFAMGLFSFGVIMILCYLLFLKYDRSSAHLANNTEAK